MSHRKGVRMTCEGDAPEDGSGLPQWHEAEGDYRTTAQIDFDTLFAYLRAGVRAEAEGTGGSLKNVHEVVTLVTAEDLERRQSVAIRSGSSPASPSPPSNACGAVAQNES